MSSWYERHIGSRLVNCACSVGQILKLRSKIVPLAHGDIVEVGLGSGINLDFYDKSKVRRIFGVEPGDTMLQMAAPKIAESGLEVETIQAGAEAMPLDDASMDTALVTFTFCTIPELARSLREIRRVLKPSGQLVFLEHGLSPDPGVAKWQRRINPIWRPIGCGCNLTRHVGPMLPDFGFAVEWMEEQYIPKTPKPWGFCYRGVARPV